MNVAAPDTASQTESYLYDVNNDLVNRTDDGINPSGRVLHIIWIGINDVIQIWEDVITNRTFEKMEASDWNQSFIDRDEKGFEIGRGRIEMEVMTVLSQVTNLREDERVNELESDILVLTLPPLEMVPNLYYQSLQLASQNHTLAQDFKTYIGQLTERYNLVRPFLSLGSVISVKLMRVY